MTLALLLLPYAIVMILFLLASVVFLYHLLKFGVASFSLAIIMIIYVLVSATLLTTSFQSLSDIDWATPLEFHSSNSTAQFFFNQ